MNFQRLTEIYSTADAQTPQSDIRHYLPKALQQVPENFEPYEEALQRLDDPTWEYVKERLLQRTIKHRVRGWAQFYDTLAEVRGYNYLRDEGYTNVRFIPEVNNARTPDIEATAPDPGCLLESKSIGFSDDERNHILENTRRLGTGQTLETRNVTQGMPQGLKDKIESTIDSAKGQLLGYLPQNDKIKRIVYLTIQLDIHMHLDMLTYTEIVNFLRRLVHEETEVTLVIDELSSVH